MKAVVKLAPQPGSIAVQDVPIPAIGPDEVLVAIKGTGICGTDVLLYNWTYRGRKPVHPPIVLGHEGAGVVVEVGLQVRNVRVGDRVALEALIGCGKCYYCRRGLTFLCPDWEHLGISFNGTFAEYTAIKASAVRPVPDGLKWEDLAFLEILAVVAHTMERISVSPGDTVVILGPGPLGLFHLQAVRAAGAAKTIVVGVPGDERRLAVAQALGATIVLTADQADPVQVVRDETRGVGADVVIEAAGASEAVSQAFRMARGAAQVVLLGFTRQAEFVPLDAVRSCLNIQCVLGGVGRHFEQALRWIETGQVLGSSLITHRFPLDRAEAGFQAAINREAVKVFFDI